ncbi:polyphosphate kinase 2 family protein [Sphingomonas morindae]|uniref:Polyphosphate kinase n=1 Tax=Sphingomonas morindae TaxID=1541170 RepID=A0ABY4X7Z3_9SPHN|nr:polyphosphate kinase [Sphingomonas morindae]USI73015.1 polyphosphate kinase [Sphingomonas morindae]
MMFNLADFERGAQFGGEYREELSALQARLRRVQRAHGLHRRRTVILAEGPDEADREGVIRRITEACDMRHASAFQIRAATAEERAHHYLARFWARLPGDGRLHLFDRSWYGRVLGERLDGLAQPLLRRAYDEINEFEAQQTDSGTLLIKLYLHLSAAEQDRRIACRIDDPWEQARLTPDMLRARERRVDHGRAVEEMLAFTHTRWAPWTVIDAGHAPSGQLTALRHVVERLEAVVPSAPPEADPLLIARARAMLADAQG